MPFVTELAIPSEAATDPNIPAFVSLHTCDFDAAHYGTRFIFAIETGHCEDDLLDMLCEDANGLRAGRLASNEHNMEYFTSLHIGDREGRTALHHAVRRGHHKLVLRILELNKQFYNDPMKDFDSEEHFDTGYEAATGSAYNAFLDSGVLGQRTKLLQDSTQEYRSLMRGLGVDPDQAYKMPKSNYSPKKVAALLREFNITMAEYEELQAQEFRFAERKQAERVEADLKAAQEEEEDADGKEADGKETDGEAADGKGAAVATTEDAKAQTGKKGDKGPPGKRKNANRRGKAGVDSGGSKPKKTEEPVEEKKSAFSLIRMHDCEPMIRENMTVREAKEQAVVAERARQEAERERKEAERIAREARELEDLMFKEHFIHFGYKHPLALEREEQGEKARRKTKKGTTKSQQQEQDPAEVERLAAEKAASMARIDAAVREKRDEVHAISHHETTILLRAFHAWSVGAKLLKCRKQRKAAEATAKAAKKQMLKEQRRSVVLAQFVGQLIHTTGAPGDTTTEQPGMSAETSGSAGPHVDVGSAGDAAEIEPDVLKKLRATLEAAESGGQNFRASIGVDASNLLEREDDDEDDANSRATLSSASDSDDSDSDEDELLSEIDEFEGPAAAAARTGAPRSELLKDPEFVRRVTLCDPNSHIAQAVKKNPRRLTQLGGRGVSRASCARGSVTYWDEIKAADDAIEKFASIGGAGMKHASSGARAGGSPAGTGDGKRALTGAPTLLEGMASGTGAVQDGGGDVRKSVKWRVDKLASEDDGAVFGGVLVREVVFGDIGDLEPKVNLMEMKDRRGFTPLVEATYMGRREIVDDLMRAGAHCNQEDGDPYVTTRLYEIGLLHGGFLQNTYGGSPSHRRLADAMQLSVVDWCVDYNYYKVTYKLRQEVRESTYSQAQARILAETNVGGKFGGHVPPSP